MKNLICLIAVVVAGSVAYVFAEKVFADRATVMLLAGILAGGVMVITGVVAGGVVASAIVRYMRQPTPRVNPPDATPDPGSLVLPGVYRSNPNALPAPTSGGRVKMLPAAFTQEVDR